MEVPMELKIYSIRDLKAETYNAPFYQPTHGLAERYLQNLVKDEKSQIYAYPEDFDLFYLGTYNTDTGRFQPLDIPQHVVKAITLKQ